MDGSSDPAGPGKARPKALSCPDQNISDFRIVPFPGFSVKRLTYDRPEKPDHTTRTHIDLRRFLEIPLTAGTFHSLTVRSRGRVRGPAVPAQSQKKWKISVQPMKVNGPAISSATQSRDKRRRIGEQFFYFFLCSYFSRRTIARFLRLACAFKKKTVRILLQTPANDHKRRATSSTSMLQ